MPLQPHLILFAAASMAGPLLASQEPQPFMGQPVPGLSTGERNLFLLGQLDFLTPLTTQDGLGPIFNEPACASCHNHPGVGGSGTRVVTRFGKAASGGAPFDPLAGLGGSLLQDQSEDLHCREVVPPEATVTALRKTPIAFGSGLLSEVLDADIEANAANQPPGLSGFVSYVGDATQPGGPLRPARFGWKGDALNAIAFSIGAGLNEMGLTSPFAPTENAPNGDQNLLAACDSVADPEDKPDANGITHVQHWTTFQRLLAAPAQTPRSGMTGEIVFNTVGCAGCHVRDYVTGAAVEPSLSGVAIKPYSDLLVHDMGTLGDGIVQANASETQMFTRPLWGLALRNSFLHDGRIAGGTFHDLMVATIAAHDGEGAASRDAFNNLPAGDQADLVDFLQSLGQTEFDYELDNDLDEFDWFFLQPWLTGPGGTIGPDDDQAIADLDADGDFDLTEFGALQRAFTGQVASPPPPPEPVQTRINLSVQSGGNTVWVSPGAPFTYQVRATLSNKQTDGLAMVSFDLAFDGGALAPVSPPQDGSMSQFVSPNGLCNPAGFGGTPIAGTLIQVGGAMNTIANSFAPTPSGTVVGDVAQRGSWATLATGTAVAPSTPGTYTLHLANPMGNALQKNVSGGAFYPVVALGTGTVRELTVVVEACAPSNYCTSKPSSSGCNPLMQWKGRPSASGPNNFHLYASAVQGSEAGLFLFSLTPGSTPFYGGTLCVGGNIKRTPVTTTGGTKGLCDGSLDFHMSQGFMAARGLTPGTIVYAQGWFRDTLQTDGTGVGLTDAISFTICP
ncbi:MAG: di-heme oxidoredictase family protein [Planctomycetota bacterium]|nr:di-heme oxidoredictase family protein [Planctomycetota bacterium]